MIVLAGPRGSRCRFATPWSVGTIVCVMFAMIAAPAFAVTNQPVAVDARSALPMVRPSRNGDATQKIGEAQVFSASTADANNVVPAAPHENPLRTYPPSCLADPLPTQPSGPTWSSPVTLRGRDPAGNLYAEAVTITLWRIVCSSATTSNSATLMRIQRAASNDGRTDVFPLFPDVRLAETNSINTIAFDDANQRDYARVAAEPNTVVSEVAVGAQIISSTTYVLENYSTAGAGFFDFDLAFSIRFDNYFIDGQPRQFTIAIPKYNPTTALYPDLNLDLPISGHMASAYGGPVNSAEGMLIQVFELAPDANGNPQPMQFYFSWFTFNGDHQTFLLGGNAAIQPGARIATSPVIYSSGGTFASLPGATATVHPWGTASFRFPNCNTMIVNYSANAGLPGNVPSGSGTRTFTRIANGNGVPCE